MSLRDVFITYAKRTPIGSFRGKLSGVRVDDLLAGLFAVFKAECGFDPRLIDDVVVGCANQAGEDNRNLARMALLLAGFPDEVPGVTVNRLCASSLDAVLEGWARIRSGLAECILVGGAENMSRAPYVLSKAETAYDSRQKMYDTSLGWRFPNPKMAELFPLWSMGETAEEVASLHKISRADQDAFALESHRKALAAWSSGAFAGEIVPVMLLAQKNAMPEIFSLDEGPRADTSLEKLGKLKPVFRTGGTVTAGNSSSLNDGASAVLLASGDFAKRHNLVPLARITGGAARGLHPNVMGLGPVVATRELCRRFGGTPRDFDLVELNEAFAAQSLACIRELDLDPARVNVRGGAIALGHPLGSSGARILTTLVHALRAEAKAKKGLATMCVGVGQGLSLAVEKA